jgi:hypothetical protein
MVVYYRKAFVSFLTVSAANAHLRGSNISLGADWNHKYAVNESCYSTVEGDSCHAAVIWAMEHGVVLHPECYPYLYQGSSWAEFQLHLYANPKMMVVGNCEEPVHTCEKTMPGDRCYETVKKYIEQNRTKLPGGNKWSVGATFEEVQMMMHVDGGAGHIGGCYNPCPGCHTALPSETCYAGVTWAMEQGIHMHPERFCGLDATSSFLDFQECLHEQKAAGCPMPCRHCAAPVKWDSCYNATVWAIEDGLRIYPHWYPTLTAESSFEEFQEFLHADGFHEHKPRFYPCPEPCRNYSKAA